MSDKINETQSALDSSSASFGTSRRDFLHGAAAGIAGGIAAAVVTNSAMELNQPQSVFAGEVTTPDAALTRLMGGNGRFVSGKLTAHQHDLATLRHSLAGHQAPYASVLTCADSRIPVEIVFDQTLGDLFVTRVAGNMVTPEIIASLEYGVAVLGTKVILVLGHSSCGAVKAAIANETVPGQISSLYPHLRPAVDQAGGDVKGAIEANAKIQARLLREASTVVAEKVKSGQVKVVAGYYDIGTGKVTILT